MIDKLYFRISVLLNLIFLVVILKFYMKNNPSEISDLADKNCISEKNYNSDIKPNVKVFNIAKSLKPEKLYDSIECRNSALFIVSTTLCYHTPLKKDEFVSGSIYRDGIWEPHILKTFTDLLNQHPEYLVLDIGAQIGQYSLFAAKMGRDVVTVEPFFDNLIRIHKAAKLEGIENRITLITNAISNKRNEIKLLEKNENNVGGQSLLNYRDKLFSKEILINDGKKNKFIVETILLDDLIDYLPRQRNNKTYEKAIIKIDIEGFEAYAFQYSKNIFNLLDIDVIFMEWGKMSKEKYLHEYIKQMLNFLYSKNLYPFTGFKGDNYVLNRHDWINWPWDIVWRKKIGW